ncbi:hypothetical protein CAPTEDRAFT_111730 [Capitella teleta]|uniref:G-protein coupled receptors family 1 profile domain-containing protein n=1 Tax=Capitella teleta TaxID=283909 RepID=X1YV58_CAPTE|nr:hypothetical protein CAPTEDRAFT_111730 [Capitella teleta]|eukprot:ELU04639.1 hypothetical protein CAPTEDRAFT_111730 [Capitella teleta]
MPKIEIYASAIFLVISFLVIVGNILILLAIYLSERLRRKTTPFIASLAVADLCVGLTFFVDSTLKICQKNDGIVFIVTNLFMEIAVFVSVVNIVAIATDRFLSIVIALRYAAVVTRKVIYRELIFVWTIGLLVLPASQHFYVDRSTKNYIVSRSLHLSFYVCFVGTICLLYGYIGITAWHQKRRIQALQIPMSDERDRVVSDSMKVTRVLMTVVGACGVLWLPHSIMSLYILTHPKAPINFTAVYCSLLFGLLNSAVNAVIYSLMNKDFRSTFLRIIKCESVNENNDIQSGRKNQVTASNNRVNVKY